MRLDVLPPEDLRAIVANRLGVDDVPAAVVALIQDRAGGHPFFATELASALLETGAIAVEGRVCRVATASGDLQDLKLPDTVQGVITSRIDRLPPAHQLTLKVASVIGRVSPIASCGKSIRSKRTGLPCPTTWRPWSDWISRHSTRQNRI